MPDRYSEDYERAAGGLDFDEPFREKAAAMGEKIAQDGPGAIFDELENMLPAEWREHIVNFPIAAVTLAVGVGMWLGMKKKELIIAAVSSLVTAAATQNVHQVLGKR